jgi:uncharacterized protein (TIGR00730 family)
MSNSALEEAPCLKRICVFCGSARGSRPAYVAVAKETGRALAERGHEIVYGGGSTGLMGAVADAALEAGGRVIGVIPEALLEWEVAHLGLSELRVTDSMHDRKALMGELADGFLTLPGGFGTLEELFEVLTWAQLGFHPKPCGLLNAARYFDPLLRMLDHSVAEGFVRPVHRALLLDGTALPGLLDRMAKYRAEAPDRWVDRTRG